jgi:predicted phage tail protein
MVANPISKFKISSIRRDSDEFVEISAVEYDEQLYDKCDSTVDLGVWVSTDYSLLQPPARESVSGVVASAKLYESSGVFKTGVEVFYDPPVGNTFWRGAEIYVSMAGTGQYVSVGVSTSGYYFISELSLAGTYQVVVCSQFSSGKQTVSDALNDSVSSPFTLVEVTPYVPNQFFLMGVSGLSVVNGANDGSFTGKDCVVTWNRLASTDAAVSTTAGEVAAIATVDTWFKHYLVDVRSVSYAAEDTDRNDPILGEIKRSTLVTTERFVYTHEFNHEDGITRVFQVTVTAYDRLGRASASKSIICNNPAPPAIV